MSSDGPLPVCVSPHVCRSIQVHLPTAILSRTPVYREPPPHFSLWQHRHRDSPALFRDGGDYLWSETERAAIKRAFYSGWKASEDHPFLDLMCSVRPSSPQRNSEVTLEVINIFRPSPPASPCTACCACSVHVHIHFEFVR